MTVIVVDATRLERNLNLVLQILEITDRAVLCLNLIDEAKRKGITTDVRALSRELGIPVVPTAARQKEGIPQLLNVIEEVASGKYKCRPHRIKSITNIQNKAIEKLSEKYPDLPNARWISLRLLEGDQSIIDSVRSGDIQNLVSRMQKPEEIQPEF